MTMALTGDTPAKEETLGVPVIARGALLARVPTVVGGAHTQFHIAGRRPPASLASHL